MEYMSDNFVVDCNTEQVRHVLMRNGIASSLWLQARPFVSDDAWVARYGPSVYLIDTLTDRGARVSFVSPGTFNVKVTERTGNALADEVIDTFPALASCILFVD